MVGDIYVGRSEELSQGCHSHMSSLTSCYTGYSTKIKINTIHLDCWLASATSICSIKPAGRSDSNAFASTLPLAFFFIHKQSCFGKEDKYSGCCS
jgi:hypothetical protein